MEMFQICAVQYGSYEAHVATELWNVPSKTEELKFNFI